ncbi:DEAD/DEAH box helicase [Stetteria hydrogenophila]
MLWRWLSGRKGWDSVASLLSQGSVDYARVVPLIRSLEGCPPRGVLEALERAGLYEEIVLLAVRGCSVPSDMIARARRFFLSAGLPKWERAASRLLGVGSVYDAARGRVAYAACVGGRVFLRVGGLSVELGGQESPRAAGDAGEALAVFLSRGAPGLYVYWGDCPTPEGVPSVDAKLLLSIAFPDVPPNLAAAAYHFRALAGDPAHAVERAARASAWALRLAGVDWDRLPGEVSEARILEPLEPPAPPSGVVVTDKPVLSAPLYKPYKLKEPREPGSSGWEYAAYAALKSLALRRGDPARAYYYSKRSGSPLSKLLPTAIAASLEWRPGKPRGGVQVEPWHASHIPSGVEAAYNCTLPPGACLRQPPPPWEEELATAAGIPAPEPPGRLPRGRSLTPVSPGDLEAGVEGPRPAGVVVHRDSPALTRPCDIAAAALGVAGEARRVLIVSPGLALARAVAECTGGVLLDESGVDEWVARGGVAVASWGYVRVNPEVLAAGEVVTLFPERLARGSAEEALAAAASLGGRSVSRALARLKERRGSGSIILSGDYARLEGDVGLSVEDLMEESRRVFRLHWRGASLRPYQEAALRILYSMAARGEAGVALVILPTGAGKSAIFQVAARVLADNGAGYAALVVSPLKALMHDQVRGAAGRGFRALYIDSSVSKTRREEALDAALSGLLDLLYITPERFEDSAFEEALKASPPALIVLDEAHTLSRWGMSFRPGYLHMARMVAGLRREAGWPPVLALTATAPPGVAEDVLSALGEDPGRAVEARVSLEGPVDAPEPVEGRPYILRAPPLRPELEFDVTPSPSGPPRLADAARVVEELARWAESQGGPWIGLVFTGYVKSSRARWANAEAVAKAIAERVGGVAVYHGQMSESRRREVEEAVARASRGGDGPRVIVATKAFGMGVDIPNIRFVAHVFPSDSVEDFYQEVGRAGRDGRPAIALALYDPSDFEAKKRMKMAEAVRPSAALLVYNAIASAASASRRGLDALVPISLLAALAGGEASAYRSLEALRHAGILEYTVVNLPLRLGRGRGCLLDLKGGRCIDPEAEGGEAAACLAGDPPLVRVSYGECGGGRVFKLSGAKAVLASLTPGASHKPRTYLPPEAFAAIVRMRAEEVDKVEELKAIMDAAARARLRGGRPAANAVVRRGIEEYFSKPRPRPGLPWEVLGKRVKRASPEECAAEAARDAARIAESLGPSGFTLAAPSARLAAKLRTAVEAVVSRPLPDPRRAYQRITATLRRKGAWALMDYGVILLLVEEGSRSMEAVARRLDGYPYHALYVASG